MDDTNSPEPGGAPASDPSSLPSRPRRVVYEPTLLPPRKRTRAPRWVVLPALLLVVCGALYFLLIAPHHHRVVNTFGLIAYTSDSGTPGHPHLWLSEANGQNARQLTPLEASSPAFSPDGSQLAFVSPSGSNPQVWTIDADGKNLQQVTRNAGAKHHPAFAPGNSDLLAYEASGVISTVDLAAGDTSRLLPLVPDAARPQIEDTLISSPSVTMDTYAWRPETQRDAQGLAAVEADGDIQALVILPTLGDRPRDTQSDQPNSPPLAAADHLTTGWSPLGDRLAVAVLGVKGLPPGKSASALTLLDHTGSPALKHPLFVIPKSTLGPEHPVFSPNGSLIVFELWQQPDLARSRCLGLFTVPADGSAPPHAIVRGDAKGARFTQGGQTILFLRLRGNGGSDLYSVGRDGTQMTRISDGIASVSDVTVSPQRRTSP